MESLIHIKDIPHEEYSWTMLDTQRNLHIFLVLRETIDHHVVTSNKFLAQQSVCLKKQTRTRNTCQALCTVTSKSICNSMKDFCYFFCKVSGDHNFHIKKIKKERIKTAIEILLKNKNNNSFYVVPYPADTVLLERKPMTC